MTRPVAADNRQKRTIAESKAPNGGLLWYRDKRERLLIAGRSATSKPRRQCPLVSAIGMATQTIQYLGWGNFNELTNFLKHADRDPDAEVDEPSEPAIQIGIGFAAALHRHATKTLTPEMEAFHVWMKVMNSEHFPDLREPDWEFEEDYLAAKEVLKTQSREVRVASGKALLQLLKDKQRN